jgi:hypothetical protein
VADYQAVFAVGDAIARHLNNNYDPALVGFPCTFKLVSSSEIANEDQTKLDKIVSLYLHRITTDENFRNVSRLQNSSRDQPVLYLDLHYLLSYWDASAEGAEAEQKILIWTMQQLQSHPILDISILSLSSAAPDGTRLTRCNSFRLISAYKTSLISGTDLVRNTASPSLISCEWCE